MEQRLEGREGTNHEDVGQREFEEDESTSTNTLRLGHA